MKTETPVRLSDCLVFAQLIRFHMEQQFKESPDSTQAQQNEAMEWVCGLMMRAIKQVANAELEGVRLVAPQLERDQPLIQGIKQYLKSRGIELERGAE